MNQVLIFSALLGTLLKTCPYSSLISAWIQCKIKWMDGLLECMRVVQTCHRVQINLYFLHSCAKRIVEKWDFTTFAIPLSCASAGSALFRQILTIAFLNSKRSLPTEGSQLCRTAACFCASLLFALESYIPLSFLWFSLESQIRWA